MRHFTRAQNLLIIAWSLGYIAAWTYFRFTEPDSSETRLLLDHWLLALSTIAFVAGVAWIGHIKDKSAQRRDHIRRVLEHDNQHSRD